MKNKVFKNKNKPLKPLEPIIINILAIAGILANTAGLFVAASFPSNRGNVLPTAICLGFQLIVFLFRKKLPYSITGILLTAGCTNVLFPLILLADQKGLSGSFVFYLFIAPVAYGVALNKKKWIWVPLATLIEYLWIFTCINNRVVSAAVRNIYLYNISFSVGYLFVFFFTFFFANAAFDYNKKLMRMSYHDDLTGLYNRRKFNDEIQNNHFRYAIMIDIDNFHEVNNEHGHQFGDLVLKKLADICMFCGNDEFKTYRYGGEEFLILSRLNTEETLKKLKGIQNLFYKSYGITLSIGVSLNNDYGTWQEIVKQADENMFFVKHNGKNNISFDGLHLVDKKS